MKADHLTKQTTDAMEIDSCVAATGSSWSWLFTQPIDENQLHSLFVTFEDFCLAMKRVQPSALREGFATVPNVTWDQVGALSDIRTELKMSILVSFYFTSSFFFKISSSYFGFELFLKHLTKTLNINSTFFGFVFSSASSFKMGRFCNSWFSFSFI